MFSNAEEYIQAMLKGRKFKTADGRITYYSKKTSSFFYAVPTSSLMSNKVGFHEYHTVTEVFDEWYKDPASIGKLCWFWNNNVIGITLAKFAGVDSTTEYPFLAFGEGGYKQSRLLTDKELSVLGSITQLKQIT